MRSMVCLARIVAAASEGLEGGQIKFRAGHAAGRPPEELTIEPGDRIVRRSELQHALRLSWREALIEHIEYGDLRLALAAAEEAIRIARRR